MDQFEYERHEAIQAKTMTDIISLLQTSKIHAMDAIPALGASVEHVINCVADVKGWDFATEVAGTFCKTLMENIEKTKRSASNQLKPN